MEGSAAGAESDAMNAGDTPLVAVTFTVPVAGCEKEPGRTLGVCSVWTAALSAVTAACRFVRASVVGARFVGLRTLTRPPTTGRRTRWAILRPRELIAEGRSPIVAPRLDHVAVAPEAPRIIGWRGVRQSDVAQNRVAPAVDDIVALGRAECLLRSRRLVIEFYQPLGFQRL